MVKGLAKEVQKRMEGVGVKGSRVTLKVKQRKQGAKPPPKFLGHGSCHNLSKSADTTGSISTEDSSVISRIALDLLEQLNVPVDDIRGMGIVVSKLTNDNTSNGVDSEPSGRITSWFGQSITAKAAESAGLASSRRSLLETSDDAGGASETDTIDDQVSSSAAIREEPVTRESIALSQVDHDSLPFNIRSDVEEERESSGDLEKSDDEETVSDPIVQTSMIAFSQPEESLSQESSSPRNTGLDDDIELPSFSQLHMSQVAELPSPMRKSIIARVSTGGLSDTSVDVAHRGEPPKSIGGTVARAFVAARHVDSAHAKTGTNMKQLSVKRMFKLAAVKSGKDETLSNSLGGSVSLTQLECLPLEMQLQVANNEEIFSGLRSPGCARKKQRRSTATGSTPPVRDKASKARAKVPQKQRQNFQDAIEEEALAAQYRGPLISEQPSFYQENIAPLKVFMDANPEANVEAVQKVREFLQICVTERRFSDAVKLLRSINTRGDAWSGDAYREILSSVNEETRAVLGRPLDLQGLGL